MEFLLEKENSDHADHYGHVGTIPDRKQGDVFSTDERNRLGDVSAPDVHVYEVYDLANKQTSFIVQLIVHDPVDNVSDGTAENESKTRGIRRVYLPDTLHINHDQSGRNNRKGGNHERRSIFNPERHSRILGKGESEPITDQSDRLPSFHQVDDGVFCCLVENDYDK